MHPVPQRTHSFIHYVWLNQKLKERHEADHTVEICMLEMC